MSKAKSFSLLSNSNSLISRSDFILPNEPDSDSNKNLLIKNLISSNNSLQYFNGKQKHLNLKQSSSKTLSTTLTNRSSPTSFKNRSTNFKLNNQLKTGQLKGHHMSLYDKNQLNSHSQSDQLNNQITKQLNKFYNRLNINQLNEPNLSSLNLKKSIDQINHLNSILNDSNLLRANESILSNLLIKETSDIANSSLINKNCSLENLNLEKNIFSDNDKCLNDEIASVNKSIDNKQPTNDKQIKTSRRKPIFVRRLIKIETDQDSSKNDEQSNCEQPLDLSLKKRKLSTHSCSDEISISPDNLDTLCNDNSFLGKQSTNDSSLNDSSVK